MDGQGYAVATLGELRRGDHGDVLIRRVLGVEAFGVNAWSASAAGDRLIPDHDEVPSGHEELYLVLEGRARFTLDGREVDAPTGTLVHVRDPACHRAATFKDR